MTKIQGEIAPWPDASTEDIQQNYIDTCAVKSQRIIMKSFGIDIPEDLLAIESEIKDYYRPGYGSDPEQVGKLLNDHGIPTHTEYDANIYDLVNELAQGHKVIVGVDADELWRPSFFNDLFGETPNHAIVVTGIDTTDPENVKVIVTDPGSGDVAKEYPMEQFIDAWHDSNCQLIATDNPVPASQPGMVGFDYDLGHIPYVCNIPYNLYTSIVNEMDVFHEDLVNHMKEVLNGLNNGLSLDEIHNEMDGIHAGYDHMLSVEKIMQDAMSETQNMFDFKSVGFAGHSILNDYWNWNNFQSDIPDQIDFSSFD